MSELQLMVLVVAVIYLWECGVWLRRGAVAFRMDARGRWRLHHPATALGNPAGGLVLAPPLPPLGYLIPAAQSPLSVGPDGVFAYVAQCLNPGWRPPQSGRWLPFTDVRDLTVSGRRLRVGKLTLVTTNSLYQAGSLAAQLRELAALPATRREQALAATLRAAFDTAAIQARWQTFAPLARPLRNSCNLLWCYLFLLAPAAIWRFGFLRTWLPVLLVLLAFTITNTVLFHRAHRRLYPMEEDDRLTQDCLILLAPASSARAHDTLARHLFTGFHPLAVAQVLLSPEDFTAFARRVVLELRHPIPPVCPESAPPAAIATEASARAALLGAVTNFLQAQKINVPDLTRPPERAEPACLTYCPRCESQFTTPDGTCPDCNSLPLAKFPG